MITRGERWEQAAEPPAEVVRGDDRALAAALAAGARQPIRFEPDPSSDLALTLGLTGAGEPAQLTLDLLAVTLGANDRGAETAVNAVVVGPSPERLRRLHRSTEVHVTTGERTIYQGRATTVVVANGQFVHGRDMVPRGHPGDGRFEVQVYAVRPGERAELRRRLLSGAHLPHPDIHQRSVTEVRIEIRRALPVEIDGDAAGRTRIAEVGVDPARLHLTVGRAEPS